MKRIEKLAEEWLRANDWDYAKYGDRRKDRSAYDTMMNYEVSSELESAFEAGFRAARDMAAEKVSTCLDVLVSRGMLSPGQAHDLIRTLGEEEVGE